MDILLETELQRRFKLAQLEADLANAREASACSIQLQARLIGWLNEEKRQHAVTKNRCANLERMLREK